MFVEVFGRDEIIDHMPYDPVGVDGQITDEELEFLFEIEQTNKRWISKEPVRKTRARKIKKLLKKNGIEAKMKLEKCGLGRYGLAIIMN